MPPGHPCLFPFFFVFPFLFAFPVFPFLLVCFLYRLLRFFCSLPCSPRWWILSFCLGDTPLRCLRACRSAYSPCVLCAVFFSCVVDFYLFIFLFLYFSISIWTSFVSSCLLVGIIYAVSSVSVSVVCVFFTLNRSFYPSTPSTPGFRADSSS